MSPLLALALAPSLALAQDDGAAGLFTDARQLPLVSQSMSVEVGPTEARVHLVQVFSNPGDGVGQADYRLWLPDGGAVDGFSFWSDDRLLEAKLQESADAEARHQAAAAAGRDTALMKADHGLTSFSVYPVPAGGLKQVEVDLRLPVVREAGRSHVRLPIDRFLGQPGVATSAIVRVTPGAPLADWGVEGGQVVPLQAGPGGLHLALSGDRAMDLWWAEDGPPIQLRAQTVVVDEGVALEVQVALNDAGPDAGGWDRVEVVVDGSASVRRRGAALRQLVSRMRAASAVPVRFHVVGPEGRQALESGASVEETLAMLRSGDVGHRAEMADLQGAIDELSCDDRARCVLVTDAQIPGLEGAAQGRHPVLIISDPNEQDHFQEVIPEAALIWGEADSEARLHALADRLVRPAMTYGLPRLDGDVVEVLGSAERVLAEGGLARHLALVDDAGERLVLAGAVQGYAVELEVEVERLEPESREGRSVRRAYYRSRLASMMRTWKQDRSDVLRDEITAISLREGIPTAFTSLQVDDPELSLVAIKPGDPILTVHGEAGLTEVVAWYPFGETRRLVRDAASGDFTDRFLVPRFWGERAYKVEVMKRFADGSSRAESVWYVLDEAAPGGTVSMEVGALVVDTGEDTPGVSRVHVEAAGRTWALSEPEEGGTRWALPTRELPAAFTVVIRDRAGNRAAFPATLTDGELTVNATRRGVSKAPVLAEATEWEVSQSVSGTRARIQQDGSRLRVDVGGRVWTARHRLDRLDATATLIEDETLWLGTRGGELLRFDGAGNVETVRLDAPEHPVTGLARLPSGALLVGVLGEGLVEVDAELGVRQSALAVGSAFITGVQSAPGGDILVGTAYNGLWRVVAGRALRSRLGGGPVIGLSAHDDGVVVARAEGAALRTGRDTARPLDDGNGLRSGSPDLMGAVRHGGVMLVAGFDAGLLRMNADGGLTEVPLDLGGPATRRINAVASWQGLLWVGTEGGLFVLGEGAVWTVSEGATHGLAVSDDRLAAATSVGVLTVDRDGQLARLDEDATMKGSWMSVAFHRGEVWAGNMEGVARFGADAAWLTADQGFTAGWATALLSDGDRLLVGTYSDGLWSVDAVGAAPVAGLEGQWVPPGALARVGERVWVGGLGMDPAVLEADGARRVDSPGRDVNGFLDADDGSVWLFTTDGPARARVAPVAAR